MRIICAAIFWALSLSASVSVAQESAGRDVWIQVEASPTLTKVQPRLRAYAADLPNVGGFQLKSGWYVAALGPYTRAEAERLRQTYLKERRIPADAMLVNEARYVKRIWPVGATEAPVEREAPGKPKAAPLPDVLPQAPQKTTPPPPDEGRIEAQRSEAALSQKEKIHLQKMLAWAEVYDGPDDGDFGPATRTAMERWQKDNGYLATGVLTTKQREVLQKAYDSILDDLAMAVIQDDATGISVRLPTAIVRFHRHNFPFATYKPTTAFPAEVLLISEPGDVNTLKGLYTLMQSPEFSAGDGPRNVSRTGFEITGIGKEVTSETRAWLINGRIKGFTLYWPNDDEHRRIRVLEAMTNSFSAHGGTLVEPEKETGTGSYKLGVSTTPQTPKFVRSGFYVAADGTVLTTSDGLQSCERVTINRHPAQMLTPKTSGPLILLHAEAAAEPANYATWHDKLIVGNDVVSAGFAYGGMLGVPSLSFGTVADVTDPDGGPQRIRLMLDAQQSDAGGPVFATDGGVAGVLWKDPATEPAPIALQSFVVPVSEIRALLDSAGVATGDVTEGTDLPVPALARKARDMTVLVECW